MDANGEDSSDDDIVHVSQTLHRAQSDVVHVYVTHRKQRVPIGSRALLIPRQTAPRAFRRSLPVESLSRTSDSQYDTPCDEQTQVNLEQRCIHLVEKLGLAHAGQIASVDPLRGGVSCDIAMLDLGTRKVCVKFALPKLRVVADWHAPVRRNGTEYAWLQFAHSLVPSATPQLLGQDVELRGFAMEFIPAEEAYLWKTALLDRAEIRGEARKVGDTLGRIHAASSRGNFNAGPFHNQADFYQLRLEPYLEYTAGRHPGLKGIFERLVARLKSNTSVLIHGDVSPKNILFRSDHPVFLDAECATMGDPSFDLAFCMNHLVLKSFHMPDLAAALLKELRTLWQAYEIHIHWESAKELERRVAELLPALMLARVDGKSPVEYLQPHIQSRVRDSSIALLMQSPENLDELTERVRRYL